jgi:biopolymer transport protein ExbB
MLILLSIAVLTISFERVRFWILWWKRRRALRLQWSELLPQGERIALAWMDDQDLDMRFGQSFLEAAIVIAPLLGLIGTVIGLSQLLASMGPQLLLPESGSLNGFGDILLSTAMGLVVSLVATVIWHLNNGLRQWQLALWHRDLRCGKPPAGPEKQHP